MPKKHFINRIDKPIEAEVVAIHAINPYVKNDSPARSVMLSGHFASHPPIRNPEHRGTITGVEQEMGKYTFAVRMPENGTIEQVLCRYSRGYGKANFGFNPETFVLYRLEKDGSYDYFTIPYHVSHCPTFGFEYHLTEAGKSIYPGAYFEKDTLFAKPVSLADDGEYIFSRDLNVCYMSVPGVNLDSYIISDEILDDYTVKVYEERVVTFGANHFPLNMYGNDEEYKICPDIGEETRDDGLLFVIRRRDPTFSPVEQNVKDTQTPNYTYDRLVYGRAMKGRVVGLEAFKTNNVNYQLDTVMTQQMQRYSDAYLRLHREFLQFEDTVTAKAKTFDKTAQPKFSRSLHRQFARARSITDKHVPGNPQPIQFSYRKEVQDQWRVVITVEYEIRPTAGMKFTCTHGGKGIACHVWKREDMPVDADGNRAHIISGPDSVPGRMNLGRLYEPYFNAAARDVRKSMLEVMGISRQFDGEMSMEEVAALPRDRFDQAWEMLIKYYNFCSKHQYEEALTYTEEQKLVEMYSIINSSQIRNLFAINNDRSYDMSVKMIEENFKLVYGPVTYRGPTGKTVTTVEPVRIGPASIFMLDKIADTWLAVDMGRLSNFGMQTGTPQQDRYETPWRRTAPRNMGETENRAYASTCGPVAVAEIMDRNGSIATRYAMARSIIYAKKPTRIKNAVDREKFPIGNMRPLQIFQHYLLIAGAGVAFFPEKIRDYGQWS